VVIFIAMSLVLFTFGVTLSMYLADRFREDIADRNQSLSHAIRDQIQAFINYHIGDLNGLRDIIDSDDGERYDIQQEIEHITASHPTFELIQVLDGNGGITHLVPYNKELIGLSMSKQPFFIQCNGLGKDHVYWSNSFLSPLTNDPAVTLSTPLRDGVIAAQLNLARLSEIIHIPFPSRGSFMAVTDRRGIAIVHSEKVTVTQSQSLRNLISVSNGLKGEERSFEEYWQGKKGLASVSLVEDSGWMVVIYQPDSEALGIVDRLLKLSLGGLLTTLLLTFGLMIFLQSRLLVPVRLMGKQALKIAEGQYDEKVDPVYAEFSEFSESFNTMVWSIKAREEAYVRSEKRYRNLFDEAADAVFLISTGGHVLQANRLACKSLGYTVEELTRMNVSDFVASLSKKESAQMINNIEVGHVETMEGFHRRKDGNTFPVEVRLAGVDVEGEKMILAFARDISRRRAAEVALSESEGKFRNIIESTPMGMILYSLEEDGRLVLIDSNPAADAILGDDLSRLIGMTIEEAFPATADTDLPEKFRQIAVSGGSWGSERLDYEYDEIQGAYEVHAFQTSHRTVAVSFIDVTERKKAEESLRESEEKYRTLFETMEQGVFYQDTEGNFFSANPAAGSILGLTHDELVDRTSYDPRWRALKEDGSHFEDKEEYPPMVALRTGKQVLNVVMGVFNPLLEEHRWLLINAIPQFRDGETEPFQVYTTFSDITDLKYAEDKVRESERRYRLLADNVSDVIWAMDMDFNYTYISPSVERVRGFTPEEAIRQTLDDGLTSESARLGRETISKHLAMVRSWKTDLDQPVIIELEIYRKDGSTMWGEVVATFVTDKEGNPVGIQGVTRDITERKWAEKELLARQEKVRSLTTKLTLAEEQERRKIATELHDRVIQKLAQTTFKVETLLDETDDKAVSGMGEELLDLINETIVEARLLTFELSPPVLHMLGFEEAVTWLGEQFQKQNNIPCEVAVEEHNASLDSDIKILLFQAARELLNNIAKHARASHVEVNIAVEDDMISVRIKDDGIGLRQDEIKVKTDDLSGFGLFNVRERMDSVGGSMLIESSPGSGTLIIITAPVAGQDVQEPGDET
jgi:PAS domain S-box-containing protein